MVPASHMLGSIQLILNDGIPGIDEPHVEEESDESSDDDLEEEPELEVYRDHLAPMATLKMTNHQSVRLVNRDTESSNLLLEKIEQLNDGSASMPRSGHSSQRLKVPFLDEL
jgi:hypothetical protein